MQWTGLSFAALQFRVKVRSPKLRPMLPQLAPRLARGAAHIAVKPPGAVRPNAFDVTYTVRDPKTGAIKYTKKNRFRNAAGQKFNRVPFRNME